MKIALYSDLHLEFNQDFKPDTDADVMVLAGDIITFKDFKPLERFLEGWTKPVLYVAGNHEYYTAAPMEKGRNDLLEWTKPNIKFLHDNSITIEGVNFFGGTMWTDFRDADPMAMAIAHQRMNDFRFIKTCDETLDPIDTVNFHKKFKTRLLEWLKTPMEGARVVISHHAPCINPNGFHKGSNLQPAYNSLDMLPIIIKYKPNYWFYGHTHEPDDQIIRDTRIISNPRGYPLRNGGWECKDFDPKGKEIVI